MKKTSTKPATDTQASKPLDKTIKFITILFRGTCPKLTARGKGDLSYELGIDEDTGEAHVRISGNDSSGAYSNEWLDLGKVRTLLAGQQKAFSAIVMEGLFRGRSTNNHGYLAAILMAEKVLVVLPGKPWDGKRRMQDICETITEREDYRYSGLSYWSKAHWNWIADIKMPHRAQQIILQEYVHAVHEQLERVQRLTRLILELVALWQLAPLVNALQALRGVSLIVAATTVAELGDLTRFESAKQFMAYLGLVPSEHSSGGTVKRGGITKTGNSHVRRALTEAAHTYCHPARESRILLNRLEGLPQEVRNIAWKAQVRLCGRFRRLMARGKNRNTVTTATARELAAFMWAIARTLLSVHEA